MSRLPVWAVYEVHGYRGRQRGKLIAYCQAMNKTEAKQVLGGCLGENRKLVKVGKW